MEQLNPIIYLPLEIKQRELDARLLIARHLVKQGYAVVMGQQWSVFENAGNLPQGAILFKTVNAIQAANMAAFKAKGFTVAATNEESLVCMDHRGFIDAFSPLAAENCDVFFAHCDDQQEAISSKYKSLKIKTVGNTRIELLNQMRFRAEGEELRDEHGPYILFNTSYGQVNSIWKDPGHIVEIAKRAGLLDITDPASVELFKAAMDWELTNLEEMTKLIKWAVKNRPEKIVIRPHPGEIAQFWSDEIPEALVIPRSEPYPWMWGADVVVHTSCTTGLEAAIMGKTVVNLEPKKHPAFGYITSEVNDTATTWEVASEILAKRRGPREMWKWYFDPEARPARDIAASLASFLPEPGPVTIENYRPTPRNHIQRDKFTLGLSELEKRLTFPASITPLDESLFLLKGN